MTVRRLLLLDDRPSPAWDPLADVPLTTLGLEAFRAHDGGAFEAAQQMAPCCVLVVVWPARGMDLAAQIADAKARNPHLLVVAISAEPAEDEQPMCVALAAGVTVFVDARQRRGLPALLERELVRVDERRVLARRQALILEAAGEGIYGVDLKGRTTFINPAGARMVGWLAEEILGKSQHALLHHTRPDGSPYPVESCPIYAAFRDGAVHHVDTEEFFRRDGSSFPVEYISTPIREDGALIGAVVSFNDISRRRAAEAEIAAHQAALESLQRELVTSLEQLLETQDMVFAGRAAAEAARAVREKLAAPSSSVSADGAARDRREISELLLTLEHLGAEVAASAGPVDLVAELRPVPVKQATSAGAVWARVDPEDLRRIVAQLAAMLGSEATVAVERDGDGPLVRVSGSPRPVPDVAKLLVRRLVGRNAASLETIESAGGVGELVLRLPRADGPPGARTDVT